MQTQHKDIDFKDELKINTDLATRILGGFIRTELERVGFKKAVIGLSGGIDSALSCYLAVNALGPENVLGIRMPYRTSSRDSLDHAQMVIDALRIPSMTIEISGIADGLINQLPDMDNLRKGNIMARARMIVLYDQSSVFNGLVIGTSNKTEILLGYSTIFGDSASALNPIGDLYKTQVRQLSYALGIPEEIILKAPSADLWAGQTDEGDLGYTYAEVDKLLYLLIDERYSPDECVERGFSMEFVKAVINRIRRNQFKRMMPPIAKLSHRSFGYDFLYMRDWGT
ncbi:MAG: NAD+ synthase [Anaerolineaceae bacterium]|nr:NAD+ synthase [Anaerolineaceae bacterium]